MMRQAWDRCRLSCQMQLGKHPKHTLEEGERKGRVVGSDLVGKYDDDK